jgi:hypothetical protein
MTYLENSSWNFHPISRIIHLTTPLCLKNRMFYKHYDVDTVSDKTDLSITPLKLGIKELH